MDSQSKKEKVELGRFMKDSMIDTIYTWTLWLSKDEIDPIDYAILERKYTKLRKNRGHYTDNT